MLDSALDALKANMMSGLKVQKPLWPTYYTRNFGVTNLWKLNLMEAESNEMEAESNERGRWIVIVLEAFLTHKEYEKRFGYR